jgi:hypothetical protein
MAWRVTPARAQPVYAEIGRILIPIEVGSSSDANYAAESGTPVLDGIGMEGDGAHSPSAIAPIWPPWRPAPTFWRACLWSWAMIPRVAERLDMAPRPDGSPQGQTG